jgi:hypothetical protein
MERRKFLGLGVLAGLAAGVTPAARRALQAQPMPPSTATEPYAGRFFLMIDAGGGWDPTMVCDPKGGDINRQFMPSAIRAAGNLPYAPITYADGYSNQRFFEKFYRRMMVLNGVDMQTNNHDSGNRFTWSGHLEDGYPPLAAIIAAALAPGRPLGFLSNGGYENTAGVVPLARLPSLDTIGRIAHPNRTDPANPEARYLSEATYQRIRRFQRERTLALADQATLPAYEGSLRQLAGTRAGANLLERLMQFLPGNDVLGRAQNPLLRQGMVALAAYQAGVTAAANLAVGGFDTHGQHDASQAVALSRLLQGVDQLMDRIDMLGLSERVTVIVGSDFGRTPSYNAQMGKDHWSVTSMLLLGAGVPGDRVIGATTEAQRARGLDFTTLAVSDASTRRLNPKSIHLSLRRFAGVESAEVARQFPLYGDRLDLFG